MKHPDPRLILPSTLIEPLSHVSQSQWQLLSLESESLSRGSAQKMTIFQMALKWFLSDQTYSLSVNMMS
jgi:hypothetical protein